MAGPSTSFRDDLLHRLEIPVELLDRNDKGLRFAYQKYKAHQQAVQRLEEMVANGTWEGKRPVATDLIEIFISKTKWFSQISQYPQMVLWLEQDENSPSDLEVWGIQKDQYSFPDLHAFLDNGGPKEVEVSGSKGKGKASVVGEKKKIVKRKAKDEENQTKKGRKSDTGKKRV
jgi:hypothetical protein